MLKIPPTSFSLVEILNGDPAASPLGGAHRLGAPYSSHRAPQRVRLRFGLAGGLVDVFLSILRIVLLRSTRADHRGPSVPPFPQPA